MRLPRRTFLRGAGAIGIGLPFLQAMTSRAEEPAPIKRLVIVFTANGTIHDAVVSGGEDDFTLGPILEPLAAHRDDLLILRGIDMECSYHGIGAGLPHAPGMASMLTGTEMTAGGQYGQIGGGISVDQFIGQELAAPTKFPTLELGVRAQGNVNIPEAHMSYYGAAEPVVREPNPQKIFDRFFADLQGDTDELARLRARRHSVLDAVGEDLADLQQVLGAADRVRLEQHLESIRTLETTLDGVAGACLVPSAPGELDSSEENTPQLGRVTMDLLAAALACDLGRVATLQWSGALGGNGTFGWLTPEHTKTHHDISHAIGTAADRQLKIEIETWYAQQFGYLVDALKALPEGEGTVFDSTAILWCNELSDGAAHSRRDMVYVLAGSCAGHFRTGRFLQYGGDMHNDLLVALCRAMGVDVDTFGDPQYCSGELPGLT